MLRPQFRWHTGRRRIGVTLAEVVVVVLILGIVGAISVPQIKQAHDRYAVEAASRRVLLDLEMARERSKLKSTPHTVRFSAAPANLYQIAGIPDWSNPTVDYQVQLGQSPYQTQLRQADFGGNPGVTFNEHGLPEYPGSVQLQCGHFSVAVSVDASGEVRIQSVEDRR